MKRSAVFSAALAALLATAGLADFTQAQGPTNISGNRMPPTGMPRSTVPPSTGMSTGVMDRGDGGYYAGEFSSDGWSTDGGNCSTCGDGTYGTGGDCYSCDDCEYGCESAGGGSWLNCCGLGGQPSSWFFTADYLYVRANFSEAIAYITVNDDNLDDTFNTVHELNFQHESSYRFGGGYRLDCCDEEIRFNFTRFASNANDIAPSGSSVPYETGNEGGPTLINADVDAKSFDLDYRKTIPLGGACCECGDTCGDCCDPCGCGDACCAPACPAWDVTWSGGLRFADVNWYRNYVALDDDFAPARRANSSLSFDGGGPRVGLEGRRYFGKRHWCSVFLKGDISVLLGQMEQTVVRTDQNDFRATLTASGRRIIPVTELEAGASAQLTKSSYLSAGYLFSAWHDLGFRDQFDFQTNVEANYDDANILGFDGFFLRLEVGY
jgi:opacity protein-like surface antigen